MPGDAREGTSVREASASDGAAIAAIYNHYIRETVITFEEEPISAGEMSRRMEAVRSSSLPWLVAEEGGGVVGYAYAARWHARSAYRYSAEIAVYLARRGGPRRDLTEDSYPDLEP
jgi:phosphinothricin acetyltransferase